MPDMPANDDFGAHASVRLSEPDPFGQAALLLAESTLHALVEAGALTRDQALDAVRTAREVKVEIADETGETRPTMRRSLDLLHRIERSMATTNDDGS